MIEPAATARPVDDPDVLRVLATIHGDDWYDDELDEGDQPDRPGRAGGPVGDNPGDNPGRALERALMWPPVSPAPTSPTGLPLTGGGPG